MNGKNIIRFALFLVGLLIISSLGLFYKPTNNSASLDPRSILPGGTFALVQLLRKQGYEVTMNHTIPSRTMKNTLVLLFIQSGNNSSEELFKNIDSKKKRSPLGKFWVAHGKAGGSAIELLEVSKSQQLPLHVPFVRVQDAKRRIYKTTILPANDLVNHIYTNGSIPGVVALSAPYKGQSVIDYFANSNSREAYIRNGEIALNRYLDQADNAALLLNTIKLIYSGKKIFIEEATFSYQSDPTLSDVFGSWINGAELQALLLLGVIIFSLGNRFGFPEEERAFQRASRELLQGISQVMRRSKSNRPALEQIYIANDRLIRDRLGISRLASSADRNKILPAEVRSAFIEVERALMTSVDASVATNLANRLQESVSSYFADLRSRH